MKTFVVSFGSALFWNQAERGMWILGSTTSIQHLLIDLDIDIDIKIIKIINTSRRDDVSISQYS